MIRCGPPYGKRKHCCYWLKHWGKKNAHHHDCACWKYSQSIESISKTILGSSCRTCASICWNLVFTSYEHRTWWINCAIVSCSFRKTTGSCSKCLAKESLWLCLAGKTHVDHVLLLKAVPHQVLTHILSASLVAQKSIRQPEGNYSKPKNPCSGVVCHWRPVTPFLSAKTRKTIRHQIVTRGAQTNFGASPGLPG